MRRHSPRPRPPLLTPAVAPVVALAGLLLLASGCRSAPPAVVTPHAGADSDTPAGATPAEAPLPPDPRAQEALCGPVAADAALHALCLELCQRWPVATDCRIAMRFGVAGWQAYGALLDDADAADRDAGTPAVDPRDVARAHGLDDTEANHFAWFLRAYGLHPDPQLGEPTGGVVDEALLDDLAVRERTCRGLDASPEAVACFEAVLALKEQHLSAHPIALVQTLTRLSEAAWVRDRPDASLAHVRRAVELASTHGRPGNPLHIQALTTLTKHLARLPAEHLEAGHLEARTREALTHSLALYGGWSNGDIDLHMRLGLAVERRFIERRDHMLAGAETTYRLLGPDEPELAMNYLTLSLLSDDLGDRPVAIALAHRAIQILDEQGAPRHSIYRLLALQGLASYSFFDGDHAEAHRLLELVLTVLDEDAEAIGHAAFVRDTRLEVLRILQSILQGTGRHNEALATIEAIIAEEAALGIIHDGDQWARATTLMALGRLDEARPIMEALTAAHEAGPGANTDVTLNTRYTNLFRLYFALGEDALAREALRKASGHTAQRTGALLHATADVMHSLAVLDDFNRHIDHALSLHTHADEASIAASHAIQRQGLGTLVERQRRRGALPETDRLLSLPTICEALAQAGRPLVLYVRYRHWFRDADRPNGLNWQWNYDVFWLDPADCRTGRGHIGSDAHIEALVSTWHTRREAVERCYAARQIPQLCLAELAAFDAAGADLRRTVWKPLESLLAQPHIKRRGEVFVIADGRLSEVPLDALSDDGGRYLVEDWQITYLPFAGALLPDPAAPPPGHTTPPARGAFVVGDVDYDATAAHATEAIAAWQRCIGTECLTVPEPREGALAALRSAGTAEDVAPCGYNARWAPLSTEAAAVALQLSQALGEEVTLARGPTAIEAALRPGLSGHRVIHLATHGFFAADPTCHTFATGDASTFGAGLGLVHSNAVDPLKLSAIALSGANLASSARPTGHHDNILSAREVTALSLEGTELVVLSACETGRGTLVSGEGAMGLARAFLIAGARTSIVSLWQVPSRPTEALFSDFYPRAFPTTGPSTSSPTHALRHAKLEALTRARNHGLPHSAYLWGSFVPITLAID